MNEFHVEGVSSIGNSTKARASVLRKSRIGDVEFPQRFITGTDLYHANRVIQANDDREDMTISFLSQVYGINRAYDAKKLSAISKGNRIYKAEQTAITNGANRRDSKDVLKTLLLNFDADVEVSDTADEKMIHLQENLDVINILDSTHIGVGALESRILRDLKIIEGFDGKKIVVVRVPLNQRKDAVDKKLKLVFDMQNINGGFIPYANPEYSYSKLALLRKYAHTPKWIHMQGVPKVLASDGRTSMMHILPFYSVDSFSLAPHKYWEPVLPIEVKRMVWQTATYLDFPNEHRQIYGNDLKCSNNCPVDYKMTVKDILDRYTPEERLSSSRVHEGYEGQYGLSIIRDKILGEKGDLFNLYKGKEHISNVLKRLEGIDFKVKPLIQQQI